MKKLKFLLLALFGILCAGAMFVNSSSFTDRYILPKWLFTFIWLAVIGIVFSLILLNNKTYSYHYRTVNIIITSLCFLQAGYGIFKCDNILPRYSEIYQITGTFDNTAGFAGCLCIGFPFCFYFLRKGYNKRIQWLVWGIFSVKCIAIFLSESRAGWMCVLLIGSIHLICRDMYKLQNKKQIISFIVSLSILMFSIIILCIVSYHWKKDSADGRLLIWRCTWEMIKDKPITGYGIGAFEAHYMDYQAKYFEEHTDSRFAKLADNVKHPFNEFLSIGVQFGVIGWILLLALGIFLVYCYRRHPSAEGYVSLLALLSIAVFALFSYPFTYPFPWIIAILNICVLIGRSYADLRITKTYLIRKGIATCLLVASMFLLFAVGNRIKAEIDWRKISRLSLRGQTHAMLPHYQKLLSTLDQEPYFLYNYAAELCVDKRYKDCLKIASACRNYWADYDLELLQAEAHIGLKQYEEARFHLEKATRMCPIRFIPLYRLHYVYKKMRNEKEASRLARLIIEKPVKVDSDIVRKIKREMNLYEEK